jgi:hypothetical protein
MKPEPGKFYLATGADGERPTPFIVTPLGDYLTVWGYSVWHGVGDYRTLGLNYADWASWDPGMVVTEDYDRRPVKRPRTSKAAPVSLAKHRLQPVPEVLALLADLTRRAKSGEIRGIAVGMSCDQRSDGSCYVIGDGGIASLYLGIERCKVRLLREGE